MILKKSIPWPNIGTMTGEIPMKRKYGLRDMSYLDTLEAKPIFETQANIIIKNNYKGIVDVGCRHGPINDFLHEKNYKDYLHNIMHYFYLPLKNFYFSLTLLNKNFSN